MAASIPLPEHGRRLLPNLIDTYAKSDYRRPFVAIPKSSKPEDGFVDISFRQLATAINRCAWWIEGQLGRSKRFDTIGYLGPADLRYTILMFAAVKTGHKAFFSSPRNSLSAHLSLLEAAECDFFLTPQKTPPIVEQILLERTMKKLTIPDLVDLLEAGEVSDYPYSKTFAEARLEPLVVLHTSGSTGIPKPVVMRHGTLSAIDAYHLLPILGGREVIGPSFKGKRMFLAFSLFHAASMCYLLGLGIYCELTCVLPPPNIPLTASLVNRIHASPSANLQGSALPPSVLVDLAKISESLERLRQLQFVIYAGGPLPRDAGDRVASRTRLITLTGSTEVGLPAIEPGDSSDWEYVRYSSFMGYDFRPLEVKGQTLYEQFIIRDDKMQLFQSIFSTFPHIDEFPMKDLYQAHPTKPGFMRLCGRTDDIISFSTGEKFNPVTLEGLVSEHPAILSALVAGQGKFQASLLVEPRETPIANRQFLLDEVWPTIEAANGASPAHARILKDYITFTNPEKPVPRTAKGTIKRAMTLELYADEIELLYTRSAGPKTTSIGSLVAKENTTRGFLYRIITKETSLKEIDCDDNLFEVGLDSIQVDSLVRGINDSLSLFHPGFEKLSAATIYDSPSITKLESVLKNSGVSGP